MTERSTTTSDQIRVGFCTAPDAAIVRLLEDGGVDSLWVGGHVASPNPAPEVIVALATLASHSRRATVGTSVLVLPLYPPALVAKQVADLDRATEGRVVLAVGVGGEYDAEFRACGVPRAERGARLDEAIPLVRALWTGEPVTATGRFYDIDDVQIRPRPTRAGGTPILVAGRKEAAMRRAATLGDGWMPYLYSPERYASSVTTIQTMASQHGRALDGFEWCAFVFVNVNKDGDAARREIAASFGWMADRSKGDPPGTVAGTPAEVTAGLARYVDAGARHLVLNVSGSTRRHEVMNDVLEHVAPALRQGTADPANLHPSS